MRGLEDFNFDSIFQKGNLEGKELVLFGFSNIARLIIDCVGDTVLFICDNDTSPWGTEYRDVNILSPIELTKHDDIGIYICDFDNLKAAEQQLVKMKAPLIPVFTNMFQMIFCGSALVKLHIFEKRIKLTTQEIQQLFYISNKIGIEDTFTQDENSKKVIFELCNMMVWRILGKLPPEIVSPNHYFPKEILSLLSNTECFCDAGAWPGNVIGQFLQYTQNQFEAIYAFELGKDHYSVLEDYVSSLPQEVTRKIKLYNCGLWNEKATANYFLNWAATSLTPCGNEFAVVDKLDDLIEGKVTLIKMDIEGAEMNALEGAARIITTQRPKMAISCYHSCRNGVYTGNSDLFDVPAYVKSLVPEYNIYIRQHREDKNCLATVCYAVI
jgi:FkbM family methyltransferase